MIKWFCDVCKLEIVHPECPTRIAAYRCTKARDDAEVGWSENDDIFKLFCHKECADGLEKALTLTLVAGLRNDNHV